ncbi:cytochrome P450 protein [Melampsora larici-populina 98AG31]|uniref:Cytochrome P450 protein n=1 Tax=Melampsora larici-populina (strain 98AG31 / pathotype 3-4-7) TaxID=747676 RepID=F4RVH2_MELLP|nr:cytochrome P450 protein [Melampsora larici-populina 98AG31]EGG03624.1 cytochrome P450 protein [Melampsora larici-populina 98AG31]
MMMIIDKSFLSIIPNFDSFLTHWVLLVLFIYVVHEIISEWKENEIRKRAQSKNSHIAPLVSSIIPFALTFLKNKLISIFTGMQSFSHLDIKYILSNNFQNWGKSDHFIASFYPLLGDGIINTDQRALWSWHRSLSRPHFSRERIADADACEEHVLRLIQWIKIQSRLKQAIDIQDLFSRLTLTVASQHLFGHCFDTLKDLFRDRPIQEGGIDVAAFCKDFADAQSYCHARLLLPSFVTKLIQKLSPNPSIKRVLEAMDVLIKDVVQKNLIDNSLNDQQEPQNLLDHLRQSGCSAQLLRHELLNLLLAAKDSVASLITSCIYELAGRDEIWTQLQLECSGLAESSSISTDQIHKLKFLRAVINETLRLHPPVGSNVRCAFEDDVLPSGIFVPAGTDFRFDIRFLQRNPEVWGKDAEEFIPDRWLDDRQIQQREDPFRFQPFSAGPRLCLGQQLAYMQASIVLIRLVTNFSGVELVGKSAFKENIKEFQSMVLSFKDGLWVKFKT